MPVSKVPALLESCNSVSVMENSCGFFQPWLGKGLVESSLSRWLPGIK